MTRTFLVALAAVLTSRAAAQSPATAADSAYASADWIRSESLYRVVVRADSTSIRGWYRLALTAESNHHLDVAADAMMHAIALKVGDPLARYRLARLEAALGHHDSAAAILGPIVAYGITPSGAAMLKLPEFAWLDAPGYRALVATADSATHPCERSAEAHQFDFWIGQWDVTQWNSPPAPPSAGHGFNDVHPILGHCIISENWTSATGSDGKSTNWYDNNLHKWRQAWMGDGGGALDYTGEYRDGAMRFEGWTLKPDGSHLLQRLTFFNIARDTVRQLFEQSADSGRTWTPTFDGRYVRRKAPG